MILFFFEPFPKKRFFRTPCKFYVYFFEARYIKGCENETHFISGLLKSFDEKVKIVDSYVATRLNGYTGS